MIGIVHLEETGEEEGGVGVNNLDLFSEENVEEAKSMLQYSVATVCVAFQPRNCAV